MKKKWNVYLTVGLILTGLMVFAALLGSFWTPYVPTAMKYGRFQAPSLAHLFGTDNFGRDIFSRVLKGIGTTLGILAYVSGHIAYASYLNVMYIPGSEEIVVYICAFVGALIGFLWYNAYPAKVFMGDTGSLSIGGVIAVTAVIIHKELMIPILCGIFFMESLSVIIQVWYAKRGNKRGIKQRVFKRTPIHDHFRVQQNQLLPDCKYICKYPTTVLHENMITLRFWIITILLAAMTIITLKIR